MKPELKLSNLIIAGIVNMVIISILEGYDRKLASLYVFLLFLVIAITYRQEIFPAINNIFATIKGGIEE